jgi:hypothetical protein
MSKWGLLQGLGRGISQGAEMINRGMQEDRAVAREEERERIRQASIEKRWKVEDGRYADSKEAQKRAEERQVKQDEKADTRYTDSKNMAERQMSLSEQTAADRKELERKARIEQTLGRFEREAEKEGEAIERQYARKIDIAKGNGVTGEDLKALYDERDNKHKAISDKLSSKLIPAIKSFGKDLEGTAYFDYYQQVLSEEAAAAKAATVKSEIVTDPKEPPKVGGRSSTVSGIIGETEQSAPAPVKGGLLSPGFIGGFQQSMAGDNEPMSVDYSQMAPAQRVSTAGGRAVGYFPGKLRDVAEVVGESAIQPAWQWLNTPQKR